MEILPAMFDTGGNPIILPLFCRNPPKKKKTKSQVYPIIPCGFPRWFGTQLKTRCSVQEIPAFGLPMTSCSPPCMARAWRLWRISSRAELISKHCRTSGDPGWQITGKWHGKTMGNRGKPWIKSIKDGCVTCRWFDEIVTFLGEFYTESMGCVCGH